MRTRRLEGESRARAILTSTVPIAIGATVVQSSLYDVPGGYRAVLFDRFSGVKAAVRFLHLSISVEATGPFTQGRTVASHADEISSS